jgi:hypothetical protein
MSARTPKRHQRKRTPGFKLPDGERDLRLGALEISVETSSASCAERTSRAGACPASHATPTFLQKVAAEDLSP